MATKQEIQRLKKLGMTDAEIVQHLTKNKLLEEIARLSVLEGEEKPVVQQNLKARVKSLKKIGMKDSEIVSFFTEEKLLNILKNVRGLTRKELMGDKGEKGDRGLPGKNGKDGRDGIDGKPGRDGKDGKDGKNGRPGPRGERGPRGPVGYGFAGRDGKDADEDSVAKKVLKKIDLKKPVKKAVKKELKTATFDYKQIRNLPEPKIINRTINAGGGGSSGIQILEDGINKRMGATKLDFGAGFDVTPTPNGVTITRDSTEKAYPYIDFDTSTSYTSQEGRLGWNSEDGTLQVGMPGGNVSLQIGQETLIKAKATEDITNGQVVYISGASGNNPEITLARADAESTSHGTIGVATEDINSGQQGYVNTFGLVRDINTNSFSEGDMLYLSGTTAGALTNVEPTGDYVVHVGVVTRKSATEGAIFVEVDVVHSADEVLFERNFSVDDLHRMTDGSFRLYGGEITDNGDGTITVSAGKGMVHTGDGAIEGCACDDTSWISPMKTVEWSETTLTPTDNAYNFIYYDYETDSIKTTTDFYSISFHREFTLGRAYRSGTNIVARLCGTNAWAFDKRVQLFGEERFPVERAKGMILGETGTRNISVTAGVLWAELVNRFSTTAFDSSTTDRFSYWYYNGSAWVEVTDQAQIDNTQYNDTTSGLAELTAQRYGVHWVYVVHDSSVHVVYGQGNYTLLQAEAASPPTSLPGLLSSYASLIGRIIIQKSASSFYEVNSAFTQTFNTAGVQNHNDLSNIQGGTAGEYYHLNSSEHTELTGWLDNVTLASNGDLTLANGTNINEFSIDGTLAGNSDDAVPTEKAVKTYVDTIDLSPTSGDFGFWNRTGTTITPVTDNDTIKLISTSEEASAASITGTATVSVVSGTGMYAYGYATAFRVYGYKSYGGVRVYSSNYLQSNTIAPTMGGSYNAQVVWTDNGSSFDGYRLLIYNAYTGRNYDYYVDTESLTFTYNGYNDTSGNTVTPNSTTILTNSYPLITNGIFGRDSFDLAISAADGQTINFVSNAEATADLSVGGDLSVVGDISSANLTTGLMTSSNISSTYGTISSTVFGGSSYRQLVAASGTTPVTNGLFNFKGFQFWGGALYKAEVVCANTMASSSSSGGVISCYELDGAALAQDHQLGKYIFGGSSSSSSNVDAAGISCKAAQNWTLPNRFGTYFDFFINPINSGANTAIVRFGEYLHLLRDNDKIYLGAAKDASLYYNGTNMYINPKEVGSGFLGILGDISLLDEDIILGTTTGTKIGTTSSQKIGLWGATPVVRPSALTAQLTTITHSGPSTPDYAIATPVDSSAGANWGFSTQDEFETAMSVIANLQTRVSELETKLQSIGAIT